MLSRCIDHRSRAQAVERTRGGEFVLGEVTRDRQGWIAGVDASGHTVWSYTAGGAEYDAVRSLSTTDAGGVVAAGITQSGDPDQAPWVMKVDSSGHEEWSRALEAQPGENAGWAGSVIQTRDGGYAVTGYRTRGNDLGLWKLDTTGRVEWSETYGRGEGTGLLQRDDRGYAIGGTGTADIRVISTSCAGERRWSTTYAREALAYGNDVVQARDTGVILVGRYNDSHTDDAIILKTVPAG